MLIKLLNDLSGVRSYFFAVLQYLFHLYVVVFFLFHLIIFVLNLPPVNNSDTCRLLTRNELKLKLTH